MFLEQFGPLRQDSLRVNRAAMKTLALAFLLAAVAHVHAESYAPRAHPIIPSLVLTDGRTFKNAKILSDTAYSVSIAIDGKILPIEKKLLPAELLAQWPIDEVRGAKDRAAEQALVDKREADAAKYRSIAEQARQEHIRDAMAYAEKNKSSDIAREKAMETARAEMDQSHHGLVIEGVASVYGDVYILVRNVSGGAIKFDWTELRLTARNTEGEHQFAGVGLSRGSYENPVITPGGRRLMYLWQTAAMEVQSVRWYDRKEPYQVKHLYRQLNAWHMEDQFAKLRVDERKATERGQRPSEDQITKMLLGSGGLANRP